MENTIVIKVEELMKDKDFVEQMLSAETAEAAQALFASRGVEFTLEEITQIGAGLKACISEDELSDADLNAVSGGIALATVASVVSIISGGVAVVDFIGKRVGWWK
jgi:predicted ribosomally synthesized peptide with nif11-like leader